MDLQGISLAKVTRQDKNRLDAGIFQSRMFS
jgi:hypothetical protein